MKNAKFLAGAGAVGATVLFLLLFFRFFSGAGSYITGGIVYGVSLLLGGISGRLLGRSTSLVAGFSAFVAAAILCLLIVLVTYGFALLGAPLVMVYGLLYGAGSYQFGENRDARR